MVKIPEHDYENVACAKADKVDQLCDKKPIKPSGIWIKKTFSDGSKAKKTFKVEDEVEYKVIV